MTLKQYFWKVFRHVSMVCGAIFITLTVHNQLVGRAGISLEAMWRIVLLGSTIVLRGVSLINFHDLDERRMRINYLINSILADLTLIALLFWYTPGGQYFVGKGWIVLTVYVVFRILFYLMNYFRTVMSAREINTRLQDMNFE